MSSSYNARVNFLFAFVRRLFVQSSKFRIPWAYILVRVTLLQFLVNFLEHLKLNTPLPIAIIVFRMFAWPLMRRLWRMALVSVTNSLLTIEGRPFQGTVKNSGLFWLSKFFWYLTSQSLTAFYLKLRPYLEPISWPHILVPISW